MKAVPQPELSIPPYVPYFHKVTGIHKNLKLCKQHIFIVEYIQNLKERRIEGRREGERRKGREKV